MTQDETKLLAAKRALEFISDGMKVGLGTGSTATLFIRELGKAVQGGLRIEAIATSRESSVLAMKLGIPLTNFEDTLVLDVNVDGADEVAPGLALIKGGHGAHLQEKIVASAARQFIVVADETKLVTKLGQVPPTGRGDPAGAAAREAPAPGARIESGVASSTRWRRPVDHR